MVDIPDYQTLMLPVLRTAAVGETTAAKVVEHVRHEFELTDAQVKEYLVLTASYISTRLE